MKGLFIPGITAEMFRNGCLESIEALMAEGEIYDIDYQQPCEDTISRQVVLDEMYKRKTDGDAITVGFIKNMPPVTPQSKMGHWIYDEEYSDWDYTYYKCSCCKRVITIPYEIRNEVYKEYPYCHCGAKMVEPQERSDKGCIEQRQGIGYH